MGTAFHPHVIGVKEKFSVTGITVLTPLSYLVGGRGSSAVERATPGEEVPGSIPPVAARSLQVGSVSV